MSNITTDEVLKRIRQATRTKEIEDSSIESFEKTLSADEMVQYNEAKKLGQAEVDEFMNSVFITRTNQLRERIGAIDISNKIASSCDDVTPENLSEVMREKTTEELEKELGEHLDRAIRKVRKEVTIEYANRRNKRNSDGSLDFMLDEDEFYKIDKIVSSKLVQNPDYKLSLLTINNAAGSITLFNDKMIESKRDLEIMKEVYCNEKGMTPKSFDKWTSYVRETYKVAARSEDSISSLTKFDDAWHLNVFRRYFEKDPNWKPGVAIYVSEYLKKLIELDNEKLAGTKNTITGRILETFDKAVIAEAKKNDIDRAVDSILPSTRDTNQPSKAFKDALQARKEKMRVTVDKETEVAKTGLKTNKIDFEELFKNNIKASQAEEKVTETIVEKLPEAEVKIDQPEEVIVENNDSEEVEEVTISKDVVVEKVNNPDLKLLGFRNTEIEETLVKYEREPDISILKSISDPKKRMTAYKNSAVVSGFRLYLPYSGYEVIVKKLIDKSRLSYLLSMAERGWKEDDLSDFITKETLKILFECLEFPSFSNIVTYKEFISNLSEGDVPILMVVFAMTNIPEDKDGRIILPFSSLKCTNPECGDFLPLEPINMDLKDLFSKIYPIEKYRSSGNGVKDNIVDAYRATESGQVHLLSMKDKDLSGTEYQIYYSRPSIYKDTVVNDNFDKTNFDLVKDDIMEREGLYKMENIDNLAEYAKDLTYDEYNERALELRNKLSHLSEDADSFSDAERDSIAEYLSENVTEMGIISKILDTNAISLSRLMDATKFIDLITVKDSNGVSIIKLEDCQDNLTDTVNALSIFPKELIDSLFVKTSELGATSTFESENVFYNSNDIKGRILPSFIERYSDSFKKDYIEYIKKQEPSVSSERLDALLKQRANEYEHLRDGRCPSCGNDTFFINYISVVFFSTFREWEVIKK